MVLFGSLVCLDSFLHVFTILPIRALIASSIYLRNKWDAILTRTPRK